MAPAKANFIDRADDPRFAELCQQLRKLANETATSGQWPEKQLRLCAEYGVFRWFIPEAWSGAGWNLSDISKGYIQLASACLTTTFVITQRTAACRRIASCENEWAKSQLLPKLIGDELFVTVAISHLSTSRRHLAKPVLTATRTSDGFVLDGFSPWVTGGPAADHIVIGATLDDGAEAIFAMPTTLDGVTVEPGQPLIALSGSQTSAVRCQNVKMDDKWLLDGPRPNVMNVGKGGGTGGLQTSTLACGLANAAISFIKKESERRPDLVSHFEVLHQQATTLEQSIIDFANGTNDCSKEEIRTEANSLVLRATQSAMVAAKGAGFVLGHEVGRWCQEALFFLVWSCPQSVLDANLCELAGIE